jgi:hypothetical protein
MSLPTVTQTWTYSFNNRYVYTGSSTLITTMGALLFSWVGVGGFLTTTMGYTVKGSCDGTTGAMDGVNRITAANKWATRATIAGAAQSWIVLTDGAGIDWLFTYQSVADDVSRLSHSQGGVYIAAGTPAQQPTATDECFDTQSGSWINGNISADRVWHFWGSSDKKMFRMAIYRTGVLASFIKGEKFTGALVAPATFTLAVGGGTVAALKSFYSGSSVSSNNMVGYVANAAGDVCRLHTSVDANCKAGNGGELIGGMAGLSALMNNERPLLQGGVGILLFPTQTGSIQASTDGKLGSLFDQWYSISNSATTPAVGDVFGNLQFYTVTPGIILPLDGVTTPLTS